MDSTVFIWELIHGFLIQPMSLTERIWFSGKWYFSDHETSLSWSVPLQDVIYTNVPKLIKHNIVYLVVASPKEYSSSCCECNGMTVPSLQLRHFFIIFELYLFCWRHINLTSTSRPITPVVNSIVICGRKYWNCSIIISNTVDFFKAGHWHLRYIHTYFFSYQL